MSLFSPPLMVMVIVFTTKTFLGVWIKGFQSLASTSRAMAITGRSQIFQGILYPVKIKHFIFNVLYFDKCFAFYVFLGGMRFRLEKHQFLYFIQ